MACSLMSLVSGVLNRPALLACALFGPAVLITLAVGEAPNPAETPQEGALPGMADWDVQRLARHLQGRGLGIRFVPVDSQGVTTICGFFTTTDKGWRELGALPKAREAIDRWDGTVFCEKLHNDGRAFQIKMWGDCCRQVGPFLLFGDRALMGEIHRLCTD
jgi:hypothetical protein